MRLDIQALRGYAVLIVMFYHFDVWAFKSGFLGVDVFFVISGYLITGMIARDLDRGTFSAKRFYYRRARRLVPSAYLTMALVLVCAWFLLAPTELSGLYEQVVGAVTFSANYFLYGQGGYFGAASELKPLLHIWSLSIEEQYYFLIPAILIFLPKKLWKPACIVLVMASLAAGWILMSRKPSAAFYWLPARAWEMGVGSLVALYQARLNLGRFRGTLGACALAILLGVPLFQGVLTHPGGAALLVVLATAILLASGFESIASHKVGRVLVWFGNISYSLYLVHWPIAAFVNNVSPHGWVWYLTLLAMLLSVSVAWLMFKYVEDPVRHAEWIKPRHFLTLVLISSAVLVVVAYSMASIKNAPKRMANHGLSPSCDFVDHFAPAAACSDGDRPKTLLWGDSYAMHWAVSVSDRYGGVIQATKSVCGPVLGMAPVLPKSHRDFWAKRCLDFNNSVYEFIKTNPSVKRVVVSSMFTQYLDGNDFVSGYYQGDEFHSNSGDMDDRFYESFSDTLKKLRSLGKEVVVIISPPQAPFDVGRCLERKQLGLMMLGTSCDIAMTSIPERERLIRIVRRAAESAQAKLLIFDSTLCNSDSCRADLDGAPVYVDSGHITKSAASILMSRTATKELPLLEVKQ
ncbi:acyltransferase family protein [Chitinibacteraceae bacterium HSL-7]